MFPFVNHIAATSTDGNGLRLKKMNNSGYLQDTGLNQGLDGKIGFSPLIDGRGFIGSGPSNGGLSFPRNCFGVISMPSSGNCVQQQRVDQGDWNLSDYGGFVKNNRIGSYVDFPPLPLGGDVKLQYSNSWVPQQNALPKTISNAPRSTECPLQPQPPCLGFHQLDHWHRLPYLPSTEQPEARSHWCLGQQDQLFDQTTGRELFNPPHLCSEHSHMVQSLFENCHYSNCNICGTLSKLCAKRKNGLSETFCDEYYNDMSTDNNYKVLPLKRTRTDNPSRVAPSTNQTLPPVRLQDSWLSPKASVFNDADMKFYAEILDSKEDPMNSGVTKVDVVSESQSSNINPAYNFSEELTVSCNQREVDSSWMSEIVSVSSDDSYDSVLVLSEDSVSVHKEEGMDFIYDPSIRELNNTATFTDGPTVDFKQQEKDRSSDAIDNSHGLNSHKEPEIVAINNSPLFNVNNTSTFSEQREVGRSSESEIRSVAVDNSQGFFDSVIVLPEETYSCNKEEGNPEIKVKGVSLADFFTAEQMKEHLYSFIQPPIGQEVKGKTTHIDTKNTCQLCATKTLVFAPTPVYCSFCTARIKSNMIYYWTLDESGKSKYRFCNKCFHGIPGTKISFNGISISKSDLEKEKANEKTEEPWVQCDKCKLWQHQICALYNKQKDLEEEEKYVCPKCCLEEMEIGKWVPLPKSVAFEAKDLTRTLLSDHIEQRLFTHLEQERKERAMALEKKLDEVPGAEGLVVRVVSSVQKQLKVNRQFLGIFHGENYPSEYEYTSKVILLFQKIDGVDVCIFGMYVQEFGSECAYPNKRCVYISYIDSVKYFRPQVQTVNGEALRTFIYHEILIGYLDYCKKRGFVKCYIWACPPGKGEDYILYCHPETQRTPKPDKLRSWYKSMLRKAAEDNVAVDYTNLYDHFFVPRECNMKITAARLPYFDGDCWSITAQDIAAKIERDNRVGGEKLEKRVSMRTLKSMGHSNLSESAKDILVMQKLANVILPIKEDFIVVHLEFSCMRCHEAILSGSRWFCKQCKDLHLCSKCVALNRDFKNKKTHISTDNEKHILSEAVVNDVPSNTEDKDAIFKNDIFENRDTFLSFCHGNYYQFDTLRRAKFSSMMILYEIQKIAALTFGRNSWDLT